MARVAWLLSVAALGGAALARGARCPDAQELAGAALAAALASSKCLESFTQVLDGIAVQCGAKADWESKLECVVSESKAALPALDKAWEGCEKDYCKVPAVSKAIRDLGSCDESVQILASSSVQSYCESSAGKSQPEACSTMKRVLADACLLPGVAEVCNSDIRDAMAKAHISCSRDDDGTADDAFVSEVELVSSLRGADHI